MGTITVCREEQCWKALLEIITNEVDKVRLAIAELPRKRANKQLALINPNTTTLANTLQVYYLHLNAYAPRKVTDLQKTNKNILIF